ncbi:restriction endonuclease subunit S [Helicobacter pylori]|uniref:restriction endonuclease subunit S n=1 Tax=Helicobacter pylori TaxID=210 RepID=UPI0002BBD3EB|nr:restriction endonuclease subunit S [Helicobacter pylori]EMH32870.1 type I restriction modification DNA specificity domain protein [Helicobacter pylori GAM80Ai]
MSDNKTCNTKKNQIVKLGDILEVLTDYHSNGSYKTLKENITLLEQPNFAIMIRTTNFEKNDFRKNLIYINQQAYNFLSKSKVLHQDILINKIANAGAVYFMPRLDKPVSLGMNLFLLRIKKNYNKYFIFCILKYNEKRLRLMAKGTTTKTITKDNIKMFQILLPPLETQQKIARTLSVLDQKIENNYKINELLHKILELLYEQYFVRFDFLDENNKPYQTSGGKMKFSKELNRLIPNDFEVKTLRELITWISGSQPPKSCHIYEYKEGYIRFIQNRDYSSNDYVTYIPISKSNKICYQYDIMMDKYGEAGSVRFGLQGAYNVALSKISVLNQSMQEYIRSYLNSKPIKKYLSNACMASTRASLNENHIYSLMLPIPPINLLQKYEKIAKNIITAIIKNNQSTQTLTALRDFLLPLLLKQQVKPQ